MKKSLEKFTEALQKRNKGKTRLEYNLEIIELLREFAEHNPELRFTQLISMIGSLDFYEESKDTLEKLRKLTL